MVLTAKEFDVEDPRFWVIDSEAAEVVRRIYQMALDGYGLAETAAALETVGEGYEKF